MRAASVSPLRASMRWWKPVTLFWLKPKREICRRFPMTNTSPPEPKSLAQPYDVWRLADMVVKVEELVEKEYGHFRDGLILFTFLHLVSLPILTAKLLEKKVIGIAYETIRDKAVYSAAAHAHVGSGRSNVPSR